MKELQHLWKLEDPQWVVQRKIEWEIIHTLYYADLEEQEQNVVSNYFLEGTGANRVYGLRKIFLTPITTPEEARRLYFSDFIEPQTRIDLLTVYFIAYLGAAQLVWFKNHCQIIATGILGNNYSKFVSAIEKIDGKAPFKEPSFAFDQFLTNIRLVLQGRRPFSGYVYLIEHAISMISHIKDRKAESKKAIYRLYEDVDYVLSDSSSTELMLSTAQCLLDLKNTCFSNMRNNISLFESDMESRNEYFGGWAITHTNLSSVPLDKQTKMAENETIGYLTKVDLIRKIAGNIVDKGGKLAKVNDSLVFRFDKAEWLLLSLELYKNITHIEYYAYHLGDESDIHLFSIASNGKRKYVKFYLDDKDETPTIYRKKFADDFKEWRLNLPKEFISFSGTRELIIKTKMMIDEESFKQS